MHTKNNAICPICGTPFTPKASSLRKGGGKFCSHPCYAESRRQAGDAQFWDKVDKSSECWVWLGAVRSSEGYGYVARRLPGGKRKNILAHRHAYALTFGDIPDGMYVCHHCDNPACVRPSHLFLGDHSANMQDMSAKSRGRTAYRPGEKCPTAKLTDSSVLEIRRLGSHGMSYSNIAKQFGVSKSCISDVIRYRKWKHLP